MIRRASIAALTVAIALGAGCSSTAREPEVSQSAEQRAAITWAHAPAGFTQVFIVDGDNPTAISDWLARRRGMRYFGLKVGWRDAEPTAPRAALVSDTEAPTPVQEMLQAYVDAAHSYGGDLRAKLMPMFGSMSPEWVYAHATSPVKKIAKLNSGASLTSVAKQMSTPVPWDPNLRTWAQHVLSLWADWLNAPCTESGVFLYPHPHKTHFWAVTASFPMTDSNTEMPDSYEAQASSQAQGTLTQALTPTDVQIKTDIPIAEVADAFEGLLVVSDGATKEGIYYQAVSDDGAGHAVFRFCDAERRICLAHPDGEVPKGRGWNGGSNASGAGQQPASSFPVGASVKVKRIDPRKTLGAPGAPAEITIEGESPDAMETLTGIFEIRAVNQNQWARVGAHDGRELPAFVRNGQVVTLGATANPSTEAGRRALVARAWMDAVDDALAIVPSELKVWLNGGQMWDVEGSSVIGDFDPASPNDALRDYVSTTRIAESADRVLWGYTTAWGNVDGLTPAARRFTTAGLEPWQFASCTTVAARGMRLGIQTEAPGSHEHERGEEFAYTAELLLRNFGASLAFVETGSERSSMMLNQDKADETDYRVTFPSSLPIADETGAPAIGVPPNPGTSDTQVKRFHDLFFGHRFGLAGGASVDPALALFNLDARIGALQVE